MFYKEDIRFVLYVNDGILFLKESSKFDKVFQQLKKVFEVEQKGDLDQFLGMKLQTIMEQFILGKHI